MDLAELDASAMAFGASILGDSGSIVGWHEVRAH